MDRFAVAVHTRTAVYSRLSFVQCACLRFFFGLGTVTERTPTGEVAVLFPNVIAAADKIASSHYSCSFVCSFEYLSPCLLNSGAFEAKQNADW
jgi:hypothetical protein